MLVIHPDECIDCGVCEPECPAEAIKPDTEPGLEKWLELNAQYAKTWPNITVKKDAPADAKEWEGVPDKAKHFAIAAFVESATFAGRSVLVANQSFFGDTSHHAILDVFVGERGEPVWVPRVAGRR